MRNGAPQYVKQKVKLSLKGLKSVCKDLATKWQKKLCAEARWLEDSEKTTKRRKSSSLRGNC